MYRTNMLKLSAQGGAIVVAVCERIQKQIGPVIGVANLDIVEGELND